MKMYRLKMGTRVVAGVLGTVMLAVGTVMLWVFFETGASANLLRGVPVLSMWCAVAGGVAFLAAAVTGLSPHVSAFPPKDSKRKKAPSHSARGNRQNALSGVFKAREVNAVNAAATGKAPGRPRPRPR